jgi:hypothetical protein
MIEWYGNAHPKARFDARRLADKKAVVEQVMVRKCRGFEQSSRATRELNIDVIIHLDIGRDRLERTAVGSRRATRHGRKRNAAGVKAIPKRDNAPQGR